MKQISLPLCNRLLSRLSLDLGIMFLISVKHAATETGRGRWRPEGTERFAQIVPASCLRATQRTAYLAADRVVSLNHDLLLERSKI